MTGTWITMARSTRTRTGNGRNPETESTARIPETANTARTPAPRSTIEISSLETRIIRATITQMQMQIKAIKRMAVIVSAIIWAIRPVARNNSLIMGIMIRIRVVGMMRCGSFIITVRRLELALRGWRGVDVCKRGLQVNVKARRGETRRLATKHLILPLSLYPTLPHGLNTHHSRPCFSRFVSYKVVFPAFFLFPQLSVVLGVLL